MNQKRFPDEFKIEAVRQIVERGHRVAEVTARLGVSTQPYKRMKEQQLLLAQRQQQRSQTEELLRLKAKLERVIEARDILKTAAAYFARQSG